MENNIFNKEKIEKINELIEILNKMKQELLNKSNNIQTINNDESKRNARMRMIRRKRRR